MYVTSGVDNKSDNKLLLSSFINDIPNCLICGKPLAVYMNLLKSDNHHSMRLELINDGNLFVAKNKKYHVIMNINDNSIIIDDNLYLMGNAKSRFVPLRRKCKTCNFSVHSQFETTKPRALSEDKYIIRINDWVTHREHMEYTMSRYKKIEIEKTQYFFATQESNVYMYINGKFINEIQTLPFKFSDFKNLKQLNKRIKTILSFC